ncbi:hypothetical protein EBZ38_02805 [bacterium]|nr:hypothetical protein [bacterium]NDD83195.1 hypothetical protein [bacterium]
MDVTIQNELFKTLKDLVNEVDLAFEYVLKEKLEALRKRISEVENDADALAQFVKDTLGVLKEHESTLSYIVLSGNKVKTRDYDFLGSVKIGALDFSVFLHENKNTKRTLVKYLYNIYMTCVLLDTSVDGENMGDQLVAFFKDVQEKATKPPSPSKSKGKAKSRGKESTNPFDDTMRSLFDNKHVMDIAGELTRDIQDEKIDPMVMLNSVLSGRPNGKLDNLIGNLTRKIERKIESGEIDKDVLQQQATSILGTLQRSGLQDQLPILGNLMKNMPK